MAGTTRISSSQGPRRLPRGLGTRKATDRRRACEIRLRAERKAGQLLAKMEKAKGGQPYQSGGTMGSPKTLKALGISPDQSSRWQALAGVPQEDFEAALGGDEKPRAGPQWNVAVIPATSRRGRPAVGAAQAVGWEH